MSTTIYQRIGEITEPEPQVPSVQQIIEDLEYITGWLGYCEDSDFGLSKLQTLTNKTGNLREQFAKEFERIGL